MEHMDILKWHDKYCIGIPQVDEQHKKFVDLVNQAYKKAHQRTDDIQKIFYDSILQALEYVRTHFADEEHFMQQHGYPGLEKQRAEHASFLKRAIDDVKKFKKGEPFVAVKYFRYLCDWFLQHIAIEDRDMASYIQLEQENSDQ